MNAVLQHPDGWRLVPFGDVVRQVKRRVDPVAAGLGRYVAGEHMDTNDLRIRRWGHVGDGYLGPAFTAHFSPGQTLYGSRRTYLRKVALADFEGVCANTTFVLEPCSSELLSEFLPYVMTTDRFHEHSIKQSRGSVNPYINYRDLTWYQISLPPVAEQKRLVAMLKCAADHVNALLIALESSWSLYRALIEDVLAVCAPQSLGSLAQQNGVIAGPFGSQLHAADYVEGGIPLLNPLDMELDRLKQRPAKAVPASFITHFPHYTLREGDIVFARRGDLNKRIVISASEAGWALGSDCIRVRLREPERAALVLHASLQREALGWVSRNSTRTTMPGTSTTIIGDMPIRLPPSKKTSSARMVLDSGRELVGIIDRSIDNARRVMSRLTNWCLEGHLDVH